MLLLKLSNANQWKIFYSSTSIALLDNFHFLVCQMVSSGSLQSNSKQPGEERKIKSKSSDSEKVLVAAESFIYKFLNSHEKTLNLAEPNSLGKKNGLSWGGGEGGGSCQVIVNDQNQLLF